MVRRTKAKVIVAGRVEGECISSPQPITFFGGIDPKTGEVVEEGHAIKGTRIGGKILFFPCGKGSTVGSYVLYGLAKKGMGPIAIVNTKFDAIIASGCIVSGIPLLLVSENFMKQVKTGERARIYRSYVEILEGRA